MWWQPFCFKYNSLSNTIYRGPQYSAAFSRSSGKVMQNSNTIYNNMFIFAMHVMQWISTSSYSDSQRDWICCQTPWSGLAPGILIGCLHKLKPENHIQQGLLVTNTYKHSLNSSITSIITFNESLSPESGIAKFACVILHYGNLRIYLLWCLAYSPRELPSNNNKNYKSQFRGLYAALHYKVDKIIFTVGHKSWSCVPDTHDMFLLPLFKARYGL